MLTDFFFYERPFILHNVIMFKQFRRSNFGIWIDLLIYKTPFRELMRYE